MRIFKRGNRFCYLSSAVRPQLLTVSIMSHSLMHSGSTEMHHGPTSMQPETAVCRNSFEQIISWSCNTASILQFRVQINHIIFNICVDKMRGRKTYVHTCISLEISLVLKQFVAIHVALLNTRACICDCGVNSTTVWFGAAALSHEESSSCFVASRMKCCESLSIATTKAILYEINVYIYMQSDHIVKC